MNALVYNIATAVGLILVSVGAGWQFSVAIGLIVAGVLVLGLTIFGAYIGRRR